MAEHDELARCVSARHHKPGHASFVDCDHNACAGGASGRCYECGGLWLECGSGVYSFDCPCGRCVEAPG